MKKVIFAILLSVLLVMAVPAAVFADSEHAVKADKHTISAEMDIMAVARQLSEPVPTPYGIKITGTVYYVGKVVDASWGGLKRAKVEAQEDVSYLVYPDGTVIMGKAEGILKITGEGPNMAIVEFKSDVSGNILTGPASDVGTWEVEKASGAARILSDAKGIWTAQVQLVPTGDPANPFTFAGKAWINGTYKDKDSDKDKDKDKDKD